MARTYQNNPWRWLHRTRPHINSIQARLIFLAAAIFFITWVGAAIISNTQGFRNAQSILERETAVMSEMLLATDNVHAAQVKIDQQNPQHSIQIWERGNQVAGYGLTHLSKPLGQSDFSSVINNQTWVFSESCSDERCVTYGAAHQRRYQGFQCYTVSIFGPLFLILVGGFALTVLSIRHALSPLNGFASSVKKMDIENPNPIAIKGIQQEFAPLIGAINDLGVRISSLLERERMFLGSCAHEIRTPLAGLLGQLQLAGDTQNLSNARICAQRTARVADQFLAFASSKSLFASGQEVEDFDLCETLRQTVSPIAAETDASIEMVGRSNIPVRAHPFAVSAITLNLVQNAIKYAHPKSGRPIIRLSTTLENQTAVLSIEDNGDGLSDKDLSIAINEFSRLHSSKEQTGAGLGLAIVREIVAQYGGTFELEKSSDLGGLRALVKLPIVNDTQILKSECNNVANNVSKSGHIRLAVPRFAPE